MAVMLPHNYPSNSPVMAGVANPSTTPIEPAPMAAMLPPNYLSNLPVIAGGPYYGSVANPSTTSIEPAPASLTAAYTQPLSDPNQVANILQAPSPPPYGFQQDPNVAAPEAPQNSSGGLQQLPQSPMANAFQAPTSAPTNSNAAAPQAPPLLGSMLPDLGNSFGGQQQSQPNIWQQYR